MKTTESIIRTFKFFFTLQNLFLLSVFVIFFLPQVDPDFGWHYKCGELLFKGNPCISNNFTYYLADYKWAYSSFLFDALLFLTYKSWGFIGTSLVYSTLMTAFAYLLYKYVKIPKPLLVVFFLLSTYFSWNVLFFGLRPQVLSVIFATLFLVWLKRISYKNMLLIPLFFVLWVNTHAGFVLAPILFIVFLLTEVIATFFSNIKNPMFYISSYFNKRSFKGLLAVTSITIISVLATLINPFAGRVYKEIANHGKTNMNMLIAEWTSPSTAIFIWLIVFYLIYIVLQIRRKKLNLFAMAILSITLYLSLTAKRNVPLFFFSYLVFLEDVEIFSQKLNKQINHYGRKLLSYMIIAWLLIYGVIMVSNTLKVSTYKGYCEASFVKYPCKAIEILEGKQGNVYNRYEWGGYLIWKLPANKLFVDGRMPAWIDPENGKSPYSVWLDIYQTKDGWSEQLDSYGVKYLLISPYTFIDLELTKNPEKYNYKEIYRDDVSVVYSSSRFRN